MNRYAKISKDTYDLLDPALIPNPYPLYERMRESDPIYWSHGLQGWVLTKYADCRNVLMDSKTFSSNRMDQQFKMQFPGMKMSKDDLIYQHFTETMLFVDPPEHTRIHTYCSKGFAPQALTNYEADIDRLIQKVIDGLKVRDDWDAQQDFGSVIPSIVMASVFGIQDNMREHFLKWINSAVLFFNVSGSSAEQIEAARKDFTHFAGFLLKAIRERRSDPKQDIMGYMTASQDAGLIKTDLELAQQLILIIGAGHATSIHMLGLGVKCFLDNPDQIELLKKLPDLYANNVVDEIVRHQSPVQMVGRRASRDVQLGSKVIRKDDNVFPILGAANRDPEIFPNPDKFDLTRPNSNRSLGFGAGVHYCIGRNLARIEGKLAFTKLFEAMPNLTENGQAQWDLSSFIFRSYKHIPVQKAGPCATE